MIGQMEIRARILLMFVGALEERPIEVVLGSAEEKRGWLDVLATWWETFLDLFHAIQQHGAIILQQT